MPWLFLVGAILTEVTATTALKLSEGFTRLVPSIVVVVGYIAAFGMLSQALTRGMGIGIAYGVWWRRASRSWRSSVPSSSARA